MVTNDDLLPSEQGREIKFMFLIVMSDSWAVLLVEHSVQLLFIVPPRCITSSMLCKEHFNIVFGLKF